MKIVVWNIRKVGTKKLLGSLPTAYQRFGFANNVLDYIVKVVTGADQWMGVITPLSPVDLFVVIELACGKGDPGTVATGNCLTTLDAIKDAMAANVDGAKYEYARIDPIISGTSESVGFIYNKKVLNSPLLKADINYKKGVHLGPRTPLVATFKLVSDPAISLQFSGVHSPPLGKGIIRIKEPIDYNMKLNDTSAAKLKNTFFLGDFNCQPADSYKQNKKSIEPFKNLFSNAEPYFSPIIDDSLSSVRGRFATGEAGEKAYLNAAYDNIICRFDKKKFSVQTAYVVDLIGKSKKFATNHLAVFRAYKPISDHLPVMLELTVLTGKK